MLCAVPQLMKVPWGGRKKYPPPSGVPGTEAPRTRTERARGRQAVPERQLGGRVLPNGKLLREKIVFLKLMTGSKRKTPMVSETLDSCFSISKYCFQFPERVEKFAHNELGMSQWGQSACGGDALVPSAICLQWLRFQPAFPISSVGGGGGGLRVHGHRIVAWQVNSAAYWWLVCTREVRVFAVVVHLLCQVTVGNCMIKKQLIFF